ncbi:MAG: hypothetical protein LKM41_12145 [Lachnospiraceae bacterium]|jgi:hypothetical protein|nr:hypothetical protein [Lachnospiraceae bacterium]
MKKTVHLPLFYAMLFVPVRYFACFWATASAGAENLFFWNGNLHPGCKLWFLAM